MISQLGCSAYEHINLRLDYAVEDELARLSTMELAPLSPPVHGGKIVTPISEMELAVMEIQAATARDLNGS